MTGTEDLFPGASEVAAVPLPHDAEPDVPENRRLGLLALGLGLFANAVNIGGLAAALATVAAVVGNSDQLPQLVWVGPFEVVAVVLVVGMGVASIILGTRASRMRRGRLPGIAGAVLGGLAMLVVVLVAVAILLVAFAAG